MALRDERPCPSAVMGPFDFAPFFLDASIWAGVRIFYLGYTLPVEIASYGAGFCKRMKNGEDISMRIVGKRSLNCWSHACGVVK